PVFLAYLARNRGAVLLVISRNWGRWRTEIRRASRDRENGNGAYMGPAPREVNRITTCSEKCRRR
ncbi:MAG: hypothetical protein ACRED7_08990, partial [Stellaceae bacterium]